MVRSPRAPDVPRCICTRAKGHPKLMTAEATSTYETSPSVTTIAPLPNTTRRSDCFPTIFLHSSATASPSTERAMRAAYISIKATTAQSRNVIVVGIECASNAYGCWSSLNTLGIKSRHVSCANGRVCRLLPHLRRDRDGELFKEIVGSLLRRTCYEALSELRELAAETLKRRLSLSVNNRMPWLPRHQTRSTCAGQ